MANAGELGDFLKSKQQEAAAVFIEQHEHERPMVSWTASRRCVQQRHGDSAEHVGRTAHAGAVARDMHAEEYQQCSSSAVASLESDLTEEFVEVEELHGTVTLGHDGQFYVALNADTTNLNDIDLEQFGSAFVVENGVDGSQTLVFDDTGRDRLTVDDDEGTSSARPQQSHYSFTAAAAVYGGSSSSITDNEQQKQPHQLVSPAVFADVAHEEVLEYDNDEDDNAGLFDYNKQRRSRVFGHCRCFECGQTFVNMARLERHLSVHQQYGVYLCPLCGKTYKYEYNLFFHWRKTCRDMNELLSQDERKTIEINALRQLVEEIAQKKLAIGPLMLDNTPPAAVPSSIGRQHNSMQTLTVDKMLLNKLTVDSLFGDKLAMCELCGLTVYDKHLATHRAVHRGRRPMDGRSVGGAFFCDLCGLMFRTHANLIRHWRTGCSTIQANLPEDSDITMDDAGLKQMVANLLKKFTRKEPEHFVDSFDDINQPSTSRQVAFGLLNDRPRHRYQTVTTSSKMFRDDQQQQNVTVQSKLDEEWARTEGVIFADDFFDVADDTLLFNEEGKLVNLVEEQRCPPFTPMAGRRAAAIGNNRLALTASPIVAMGAPHGAQAVRGTDGELQWIQYAQSVQCSECYRSFSSVQRLEKHMAGTHCSFGTHHCLLCGSRFKYEYNLLFHYRQVCPHTQKQISKELRQQMEAVDLKKAVRQIASTSTHSAPLLHPSMASAHLTPQSSAMQQSSNLVQLGTGAAAAAVPGTGGTLVGGAPAPLLPATDGTIAAVPPPSSSSRPELGDSVIRRQMMKKIIQKHAKKERREQHQCSPSKAYLSLPQQLLQPIERPNWPDGTKCPICSIVFYGLKVLVRHLRAAHPNESSVWERTLCTLDGGAGDGQAAIRTTKLWPNRLSSSASSSSSLSLLSRRKRKMLHEESEERPPQLERTGQTELAQQQQQQTVRKGNGAAPQYYGRGNNNNMDRMG
uniref:C2H2-type domain-containing protein n=1 Tax=Globodera rostochiensis TaxID=31243 RepID=A0A914HGQ4_GLORO